MISIPNPVPPPSLPLCLPLSLFLFPNLASMRMRECCANFNEVQVLHFQKAILCGSVWFSGEARRLVSWEDTSSPSWKATQVAYLMRSGNTKKIPISGAFYFNLIQLLIHPSYITEGSFLCVKGLCFLPPSSFKATKNENWLRSKTSWTENIERNHFNGVLR